MKKNYNTKIKSLILQLLEDNKDRQFSVSEIHDFLHAESRAYDLSTVYRALDTMYKNDLLLRFVSEDGKRASFQFNDADNSCDKHLHAKCGECGKVFHLNCDLTDDFLKHVAHDHNLSISCDSSLLYGLCGECSNKAEDNKSVGK